MLVLDDVDHLVELIGVVALDGPCDVVHDVDGRLVCLLNDRLVELSLA